MLWGDWGYWEMMKVCDWVMVEEEGRSLGVLSLNEIFGYLGQQMGVRT